MPPNSLKYFNQAIPDASCGQSAALYTFSQAEFVFRDRRRDGEDTLDCVPPSCRRSWVRWYQWSLKVWGEFSVRPLRDSVEN